MTDIPRAEMCFLIEPSRGVFVVSFRMRSDYPLVRVEISRDQLANFLVDGAAMALRTESAA